MFEFAYIWVFLLAPLPLLVFWLLPPLKQRKEALRFPRFIDAVEASGQKASSDGLYGARLNLFII